MDLECGGAELVRPVERRLICTIASRLVGGLIASTCCLRRQPTYPRRRARSLGGPVCLTPPSFGIPGPSFPKVRHITGLDEVLGWLATFDTELPGFRIEPDELIDLGDLVLALVRVSGEGRARSAQVEIPAAHLFTLRDGSAVQVRSFLDHAEARQAAGIAE